MRKGREGKLNRLIGRTQEIVSSLDSPGTDIKQDSIAPVRSMIDVTFRQQKNDMFGRYDAS